ncbi:sigma-54 dependent transcriptional regulator [Motilimonas sp. E26]|uniref:sigma-54-dependent transcriptional regulator n=1 Tax=Motilimonas sp. E26 TaxID=2865674 RepID=UPI001E30C99E|nr:sigma-54 dependent transcriptional regulator [Motilimonas sp. E26]MCE0559330.1 sigma-54 dependent transcriptional regulator [Motilimonas sp. E26]
MNNSFSVLLVDDDQDVLEAYAHLMSIISLTTKMANDPTRALLWLQPDWIGVVLLDMYMPQMNGMDLLKQIKELDDNIPVIVITGHGDIPMAVEAVKLGAVDFLEKPIDPPELLRLVKKHLELRRHYIEHKTSVVRSIKHELIGKSAHMEQIRQHVAQYAMLNSHVVISGESGVGRHTIAYLIHHVSQGGKNSPFIELRATPDCTLEEIDQKIAQARGGVLLIEAIEQLPETMQRHLAQQLLHLERLNQSKPRVVTIFNCQPEALIQANQLQPELYYLLNQGVIDVPPLQQRPDDIAVLFHYFLKQSCKKLGKSLPQVEKSYLALLRAHDWPGNVRELRNIAELYAIGIVKLINKERLYNQAEIQSPLDELVDDYEKQVIEDALFLHAGRVADAASYLQIPRKKLYLRMKKHGIEKDSYKTRT